ncbi:unnamed protein product [Ambrosiozyma monospora]|uniref:Unnamed protein product n=1 Tax=Ambrosiozyma monospora TaxID=43982 RepID=A0ACB5SZM7_AMBMO|nr:unnamed protein product [Ambrosiozyma monospora]
MYSEVMWRLRKEKVKSDFKIEYPNPQEMFSQDDTHVTGKMKLEIIHHLNRVLSIDIGFRGYYLTRYTEQVDTNSSVTYEETTDLFDESRRIFEPKEQKNKSSKGCTLPAGESFDMSFAYEFPSDQNLPSSCYRLGKEGSERGNVSVCYEVYTCFSYIPSILGKKKKTYYSSNLKYQGCCDVEHWESTHMSQSSLSFPGKLKIMIPDEEQGVLVKNYMKGAHVHSRLLRSVFDDNYKKGNIDQFAKKSEINVKLSIPQPLYLYSTLDAFSITFELPLNTSLEPDYTYKGQSTKLGFFRVTFMWLKLIQDVKIYCKDYSYKTVKKSPLLQLSDLNVDLDVANFKFDEANNTYFHTTTLGKLVGDSISCIISKTDDPIVGDFDVHKVFTNKNTLSLNMEISDA